jgi:hypothetical protein
MPPPPSRGRPRGSRNRLRGGFLADLAADWEEHGADVIRIVRIEEPGTYLKIVASLLPREMRIESVVSDMRDDELDELIEALRERRESLMQASPLMIEGTAEKSHRWIRKRTGRLMSRR